MDLIDRIREFNRIWNAGAKEMNQPFICLECGRDLNVSFPRERFQRDTHCICCGGRLSDIKPPLGLRPRRVADHARYIEICEAISRYYNAGEQIPVEWIEEYNELAKKEKERK